MPAPNPHGKMRNIGPTSSHELAEIGIKSRSDLIKAGIEETARRLLFRFGGEKQISVNYLYALEGAIHDHDWRDIAPSRKQELRDFLVRLRSEIAAH
ncbi:TfoX/Sxy family DNA transformation protein [Thalassospira sp. SN3W]|uniref:TfoX/Sxy family DNA transformation protein n=1 Tax=Thalassospira sp. SN3W TaxID=3035476 RepID=UPI00311B19A7